MVYIYILKLENDKYYIGKTNNPSFRIENHKNGTGSFWTRKYKPISVERIIPNCDIYDEDKYTIQYMDKYGIPNVRGGSFTQFILPLKSVEIIKQMCKGANNKCFKCGESGHFIGECNTELETIPFNDKNSEEYEKQEKDTLDNERKNNVVLHVIISILECCLCLRE